jgi:hypothetical protein
VREEFQEVSRLRLLPGRIEESRREVNQGTASIVKKGAEKAGEKVSRFKRKAVLSSVISRPPTRGHAAMAALTIYPSVPLPFSPGVGGCSLPCSSSFGLSL